MGGVIIIFAFIFITRRRRRGQRRNKSRIQGYEPTTTANTTELASTSRLGNGTTTNVTAPAPAQTAGGNVDRHTSVRSVMTLPAYQAEASTNEQVLGRAGDRDGIDVIVDMPTEEHEEALRDEEMEALYQIRNLRRQQIEAREQRRVEREEARARGDEAALAEIRQRSRIARDATNASNDVISELRQDASRAQGNRLRSTSTVSYADLGIARHDGSRLRASSNDSERMGLLADAASIAEAAPESRHGRNQSVTSFVSADSGPPSPAYRPRSRASSRGRRGAGESPLGSSPDMVDVQLELGDESVPPPGYVEVSPVRNETQNVPAAPPPEYTEGDNASPRPSNSPDLQPPAASATERPGSFTGPVPQIVIETSTNQR